MFLILDKNKIIVYYCKLLNVLDLTEVLICLILKDKRYKYLIRIIINVKISNYYL